MAGRVSKSMKIAGKIGLVVVGLCVIAAVVGADAYLVHRNRAPGKYGSTLEFRLAAMNTKYFDSFDRAPGGFDVFSVRQAQEIEESGVAPAEFTWMPVSRFYLTITGGGIEPRGITRVSNGQEFLLVAERPEMMLAHGANVPAWGVKSVQMTETYKFGPVVKAVEFKFDDAGGKLLRQFTEKYVRHSMAVIVDGQVVVDLGLLSPVRRNVMGLSYPEGAEAEAERLRDALMR